MERLPRTGEEVPVGEIQRVSGGTAANVSVAATRKETRGGPTSYELDELLLEWEGLE
jgi:sugar/nucleoside kinase (ribokinase family)